MTRVTPAGLLVFWEEGNVQKVGPFSNLDGQPAYFSRQEKPFMDMTDLLDKLISAVLALLAVYACTSYRFLARRRSLGSYRELRVQAIATSRPVFRQTGPGVTPNTGASVKLSDKLRLLV